MLRKEGRFICELLQSVRRRKWQIGSWTLFDPWLPAAGCRLPVYVDVVQRLPDQFGGGIIIWEMSACLDDIA